MCSMWLNSDPGIQELALGRLQHYYVQILDQPHRNAFDQYVTQRYQEAEQSTDPAFHARAKFYLSLLQFYVINQ